MTQSASLTGLIHLSSEVLFRELQGEAVLLDLRSQHYFGLDEVGTRIWQLLAEHGRAELVLKKLLQEFDVDEASLTVDLAEFLTRLESAGLISVSTQLEESQIRDLP